jgi:hypothetical protein
VAAGGSGAVFISCGLGAEVLAAKVNGDLSHLLD